jgi:hypothetical protein
MRFWLHDAAEEELDAAVAYYESCRPGLGVDFANEVYAAIVLACDYPEAGAKLTANTRRRLIKRFPFGVIYQRKAEALAVIAIADLRRKPAYWRKRLDA